MNAIKNSLSFFMPEEKTEANRRKNMRLSGDGMTAIVGETYYDVINWSQGGLLLKASNANSSSLIEGDLDLTLKFHSGESTNTIVHSGKVIRKGTDSIAVLLEPLAEDDRLAFSKMVDSALTESFISSQLS